MVSKHHYKHTVNEKVQKGQIGSDGLAHKAAHMTITSSMVINDIGKCLKCLRCPLDTFMTINNDIEGKNQKKKIHCIEPFRLTVVKKNHK